MKKTLIEQAEEKLIPSPPSPPKPPEGRIIKEDVSIEIVSIILLAYCILTFVIIIFL